MDREVSLDKHQVLPPFSSSASLLLPVGSAGSGTDVPPDKALARREQERPAVRAHPILEAYSPVTATLASQSCKVSTTSH